ncbi:MAG: hypothetical protein U1G07_17415 [Verrucomicrobiota bacterium]
MRGNVPLAGCASCGLSRRRFITGCAACLGTAGLLSSPAVLRAAAARPKTRIRVIYALHADTQPGPDWPNKGFEFGPVMQKYNTELARRCRDFEFVSSTATGEEQARKVLEADQEAEVDGYLVFQMNCWNRVVQTIAASGKPVLYADFPFGGSGGFLTYNAAFLRNPVRNVGFVASSQIKDLTEAVNCFGVVKQGQSIAAFVAATDRIRSKRTHKAGDRTCKRDGLPAAPAGDLVRRLRESRVLAVRSQEGFPAGSILGVPIVQVPFAELNEAWKAADRDQAKAVADQWEKTAESITGVNRETLDQSAAMYLAERALLKKYEANAISINCLGGFYGGHIHAYPCLGFHQLLNEGLIGGCECDVRSAVTMVLMNLITQGRPGYISDPVIDTSQRQIIYAHCVASNRAFGPNGPTNPFEILTHSEDRQGASVRSLLPLGYLTTTLQVAEERKEILLHQGKTIANDPDDRACRTKLCVEPFGDIEKLFTQWDQWGWHRVTCYGDLKPQVYSLADELGWKVVEEA